MSDSGRLGDAITAITAALTAAPALAGVTIVTGTAVTAAADPEFLVVGHDGSLDADGALAGTTAAGDFLTEFVTAGNPAGQQETGNVNVTAVSQTGDATDLPARISRVQAMLAACDDATTDLHTSAMVFDGPGGGQVVTRQISGGAAAIITFQITYTAPW
jgi:hypothetical protein